LGSQRISREVVSWEAMLKDDDEVRRVVLVFGLAGGGCWEGSWAWLLLIGWCSE
jgi:hypothetical protein